ncbi:MAG: hypothetical protein ACREAD_04760 [Nitrosopumilaceae archaeon]
MSSLTTIALKPETRDKLAARGKKDQTFDEIVNDLLKNVGS